MKGIVAEIGSFPPHYVVNVVAIGRVGSSFLHYAGDCSVSGFTFSRVFLHGAAQSKTWLWIILFYVGSFLLIHKQKGRAGDDSFYTNACLLIALPQLPGSRRMNGFSSKNQCCSFLYTAKSITLLHVCLPVQGPVTVSNSCFISGCCKPTSPCSWLKQGKEIGKHNITCLSFSSVESKRWILDHRIMNIRYVALETGSVIAVALTPEGCRTLIEGRLSKNRSGAVTSPLLPSPAEICIDKLMRCQLPLRLWTLPLPPRARRLQLFVQANLSKAISKQSLKGTALSFKTEESKGHINILHFFHALLNYPLFCQTAKKNLPITAPEQDWYNWLCGNSSIS